MNKLTQRILIIGIIIIIIGAGIMRTAFRSQKSTDEIVIGGIFSQTGVAASYGEFSRDGALLAEKMINESGGVNGRSVRVIIEDDATDPKIAMNAYQKLVHADKVKGIIGSNWDFVTQPLLTSALQDDIPLITPSNVRVTGSFELPKTSFTMLTDFSNILEKLREVIIRDDIRRIAIVSYRSTFGDETARVLSSIAKEYNKYHEVHWYGSIGNNDFRTMILKMKNANIDTVYLDMVGGDPITFIRQARAAGFNPLYISNSAIADSLKMSESDNALFEGMIVINWEDGTGGKDFEKAFENHYGKKPQKLAHAAFDAVYILAQSIDKSNETKKPYEIMETEAFVSPFRTISFNKEHTVSSVPVVLGIIRGGVVEY